MNQAPTHNSSSETLKDSEELFTAFMRYLPGAAFIKSLEGKYVFVNGITRALQNLKVDTIGKTDEEIFSPELAAQFRGNDQKVIDTGDVVQGIETAPLEGEMHRWFTTKFPIRNKEGAIVMVGAVALDITERRRAEEALRESELRFYQMAESSSDVFWMGDPHLNKLIYISPAYETVSGRSSRDLYEHPDSYIETLHPDDRGRIKALFSPENAGTKFNFEFRIVRPDGAMRWIAGHRFPVLNEKGEFMRVAGILRDITAQKQAEAAIQENQARLRSLSHQLIEAQEAERRRIARDLHDNVGQALTGLKLNIHAAQQSPDAGPLLAESLELINHILAEVRQLSLELRPLALDDFGFLAALEAHINRLSQRSGIAMHLNAKMDDYRLPRAMETACFRVAQEALTNIIRHSNARNVDISLIISKNEVQIRIADDGVGFDVSLSLAKAAEGRSLGLLGMQERAEALGGRVEIQSSRNHGTIILLSLPYCPESTQP